MDVVCPACGGNGVNCTPLSDKPINVGNIVIPTIPAIFHESGAPCSLCNGTGSVTEETYNIFLNESKSEESTNSTGLGE